MEENIESNNTIIDVEEINDFFQQVVADLDNFCSISNLVKNLSNQNRNALILNGPEGMAILERLSLLYNHAKTILCDIYECMLPLARDKNVDFTLHEDCGRVAARLECLISSLLKNKGQIPLLLTKEEFQKTLEEKQHQITRIRSNLQRIQQITEALVKYVTLFQWHDEESQ